jgi:hypothetical protein
MFLDSIFFSTPRGQFARFCDVRAVILTLFCYFSEKFGVLETFELKEGGSSIPVTNENKVEYVKLLSEHRLRNSVRKQMQVLFALPCLCFVYDFCITGISGWFS